jgi:hypothetical protein
MGVLAQAVEGVAMSTRLTLRDHVSKLNLKA